MLEDAECPTLESLKSSYILYLFPGKKKKYIYIYFSQLRVFTRENYTRQLNCFHP